MPDSWAAGEPYENFMGRWSRPLAQTFLDWLAPPAGLHWLEVGCGTGALSQAILSRAAPASLLAVDPSEAYIEFARRAVTDPRADFKVGDAVSLPAEAQGRDVSVSGLVLNFIPDPLAALRAMHDVLQPGGIIGLYVWDYSGQMDLLRHFWDAAAALDPAARALDEGERFPICQPEALRRVCAEAGLKHIEVEGIETAMAFADFDDYWTPFLGGQGPAPGYVAGLDADARAALESHLRASLPFGEDGSLQLKARAWAVRART